MITAEEKIQALRNADNFAELMEESPISPAVIKLIVNNLNPSVPGLKDLVDLMEKTNSISAAIPKLIESLVKTEEAADGLNYTTAELSEFFQVSQTTINKWINSGRFLGIKREANKHIKINENVFWASENGSRISVKEIVNNYMENHLNVPELSEEEEIEEIRYEINRLEDKHGGNLKEKFEKKSKLTFEEEKDYSAWVHFSNMLRDIE